MKLVVQRAEMKVSLMVDSTVGKRVGLKVDLMDE